MLVIRWICKKEMSSLYILLIVGLSTSEAIQLGKKEIASTDLALVRAQKVVADTIDIGTKTAETLDSQTKQLERVMDDLEEIHFSMKKASQVIRDMTRGMATDK